MEINIYTFAEERRLNLSRVTDITAGVCPLGPSKKVKAAIRKAAKDIDLHADQECSRLRALFLSRYGIAGESLLFANSPRELIYLALAAFRPLRVVLPGPAAVPFEPWSGPDIVIAGGVAETGLPPDLPGPAGRDLLYVSNPNRITGRLSARDGLWKTLRTMASNGTPVMLDESLIEFCSDDRIHEDAGLCDNLVVMRTTSNFYGLPGLELAYAVSSPQTLARLKEICRPSLNHLAMEAARIAFKDKTYIRTAKLFIADERRLLFNELGKIKGVNALESGSNVFLLDAGSHRDRILSGLHRAGFMTRDCSGITGLGGQYLRLSVLSHDKNRKVVRIIKEAVTQQD